MAQKGIGRGRGGKGGQRHTSTHGPRQPLSMKKGGPGRPAGQKGPGGPGASGFKKAGNESSYRHHYKPAVSKERPGAAGNDRAGGGETFRTRHKTEPQARELSRERGSSPGKPSFHYKPRGFKEEIHAAPRARTEPSHTQQTEPLERVMGVNPVLELLRSGSRPVDALYIDKDKGGKQFGEMVSLARKSGISVKVVPRAALDGMSGDLRHQGALAVVSPKKYADAYSLVEEALAKGAMPLLLILDGVEDPQNLGAIIRTAEAAGADGVVIPEHRAAHLSSVVARASAGALEHMPVAKTPNLAGFTGFLKEKGFWVVGLAGESGQDYTAFDMKGPLAVVLGGEGPGIRPVVRKSCDLLVSLPMLGHVSSLNVSVAAGVMLYEIIRQRKIPHF